MLRALAYLGVVLLSLSGAGLCTMSYAVFSRKEDYEGRHIETLFGLFCGVTGVSLVMTAVAVARGLE